MKKTRDQQIEFYSDTLYTQKYALDLNHLRTDFETSIYSDAYALKALKHYQNGKLVTFAWLSRGLVSLEDIATWRFEGDKSAAEELLKQTPGCMQKLLALDSLPEVADEDEKQLVQVAKQSRLKGETISCWSVLDQDASGSDEKPKALPEWFQLPIDKTIAIWQREQEEWNKKRNKRFNAKGTYELPKATEAKYQAWLLHACSRRIVLNKVRKAQVVNFQNKSMRKMSKDCILLRLQFGDDASSLRLHAGNGKEYQLMLMQGLQPTNDIPLGFDFPPGLLNFEKNQWLFVCLIHIYVSM